MAVADVWPRFFKKINDTCAFKAQQVPGLQNLSTDVEQIVDMLNSDDLLTFIRQGEQLVTRNNHDEAFVMWILEREMVHVADKPAPAQASEADDLLDEGEEVKGSAEKLLKWLPDYVKKLLKLLNEIMKLIRAGG